MTKNLLEMVTDRASVTIASKQRVICGISIGILQFIFSNSKVQDQSRTHFYCDYLENCD